MVSRIGFEERFCDFCNKITNFSIRQNKCFNCQRKGQRLSKTDNMMNLKSYSKKTNNLFV